MESDYINDQLDEIIRLLKEINNKLSIDTSHKALRVTDLGHD
jgi:hypothetical protein